MIPYNNVTIFVSLSWKIYILVHYQHFEDRQVNIYKVNININFSIFISCNKNETNIPLFQFQMMYLNYFLNKIVQRIKNLHCASIIIIMGRDLLYCCYFCCVHQLFFDVSPPVSIGLWDVVGHIILEIIQTFVDKKFDPLW